MVSQPGTLRIDSQAGMTSTLPHKVIRRLSKPDSSLMRRDSNSMLPTLHSWHAQSKHGTISQMKWTAFGFQLSAHGALTSVTMVLSKDWIRLRQLRSMERPKWLSGDVVSISHHHLLIYLMRDIQDLIVDTKSSQMMFSQRPNPWRPQLIEYCPIGTTKSAHRSLLARELSS